jgi:beta-xylosidase
MKIEMVMKNTTLYFLMLALLFCSSIIFAQKRAGNPIFEGWYADPEGIIFHNQYWIFPTMSGVYGTPDEPSKLSNQQLEAQKKTINKQYLEQTYLDAFSSKDLITWKKHPHVLDIKDVKWAAFSIWAPSIIKANKQYYLFFGANDIQNNNELGGIGVAVSKRPKGPYKDALGKPLVDKIVNGAQPIDQFVFRDDDGQYYMYYGGWGHCNVGKMNDDLLSFKTFEDGETFKEITPENYVEGPFMFKRNGHYYFMWSEGGWGGPNYSVAYAIADSPLGPFKRIGKILKQNPEIATGAGHHSVIHIPNTDDYYIVYHRRPLDRTRAEHRVVCIDRMYFDEDGSIKPVEITVKGVSKRTLK